MATRDGQFSWYQNNKISFFIWDFKDMQTSNHTLLIDLIVSFIFLMIFEVNI